MWSRLLVPVLGIFWVVMSLLIWRSEYGHAEFAGTPVHPDVVWGKIVTSPDSSSLAIMSHEVRIGYCHLITSVAEQLNASSATNMPEGLVHTIRGYRLDLSGSISSQDNAVRVRFDGDLTLDEYLSWESFRVQLIARPLTINADSRKAEGLIHVKVDGPEYTLDRDLRLSQLDQPESLLAEFFGPTGPFMLGALPFSLADSGASAFPRNVGWSASTDRIKIGQSTAQIYRLELKMSEGYKVLILVSRAGEILRVELPEDLMLINEALSPWSVP